MAIDEKYKKRLDNILMDKHFNPKARIIIRTEYERNPEGFLDQEVHFLATRGRGDLPEGINPLDEIRMCSGSVTYKTLFDLLDNGTIVDVEFGNRYFLEKDKS